METTLWKGFGLIFSFILILFCELCNGMPINLENTIADSHVQLITGLIGVLLTVCGVVLVAGCLCCQRKNGFKEFRDSPVVSSVALNIDHGHVNPIANSEFTIFTPLSPPGNQNSNALQANGQDYDTEDFKLNSWFDGSEQEFPRERLKYIKEIGKGWFGKVVEGVAQDINDHKKWTPVSVRILEATASSRERAVFLHDAMIYRCSTHPNILQLFGRCLDTIPLLILQEFCSKGDLKKYLQEANAEKILSTEYPLAWCCQLTSALKHIHENNLTHSDLAARNCQLSSDNSLKLGDYGLSVFNYPEDYYQGAPGVSIRWCAPESISYTNTTIEPKKVTPEANIWSLGVTIWEICECGERPYSSLSDDDVISQVLDTQSVRLGRPKVQVLYTDYLYSLVKLCWTNSESRPTITQLDLMLADLYRVYQNTKNDKSGTIPSQFDENFDQRWQSLKPNALIKTDNHNQLLELEKNDENEIVSQSQLHDSMNNLLFESIENANDVSDFINDNNGNEQMPNNTNLNELRPRIEFQLDSVYPAEAQQGQEGDSMTNSMIFNQRSSGSETEEENWKSKIERGIYSEKVRQKSRSVADLMILTHIDCSESDSETPSLDAARARKLPSGDSIAFSSESNLLNLEIEDTFQEEIRKLKEERRDSLLFVPETNLDVSNSNSRMNSTENGFLLHELGEIQPAQQVYNIFNVSIEKFSPIRVNLDEIINLSENDACFQVPKLSEIIERNAALSLRVEKEPESEKKVYQVPKLFDLIQSNDYLMDYIIDKYENEIGSDKQSGNFDSLESLASTSSLKNADPVFDLGANQDKVLPNNLTHSSLVLPVVENEEIRQAGASYEADLYSLETWDNFLGRTFDDNRKNVENGKMFDGFSSSEPKSLLFIENDNNAEIDGEELCSDSDGEVNDKTYTVDDDGEKETTAAGWDSKTGWFLHPPMNEEFNSDEMNNAPGTSSGSYLGFSMDDEIMTAIRNELITKLPQAQSCSSGSNLNEDEWETTDRNEVFLRYNVYNTLLSPIPEECLFEDQITCENTPRPESDEDDSDWSENCKREELEHDLQPEPTHRHTPSQDSCCSNDTLFNLEDLTYVTSDIEKESHNNVLPKNDDIHIVNLSHNTNIIKPTIPLSDDDEITNLVETKTQNSQICNHIDDHATSTIVDNQNISHKVIEDFLNNERELCVGLPSNKKEEVPKDYLVIELNQQIAPLPSPEDNPWKQLPESLLLHDKFINNCHEEKAVESDNVFNEDEDYMDVLSRENAENGKNLSNNGKDIYEIDDYDENSEPNLIISDSFGALTDIRFSGPSDSQLMTTSFSESNDLNDDPEWDSGSDTRSSSSGEFIWKEGEHEEFLKVLQAAPQDVHEEEKSHKEEKESVLEESASTSEEDDEEDGAEGDGSEFVPSAWDQFATPRKSALRSPEKTLEKTDEKKPKGVWFKKQKYHCVYEYPREPESPVLHSYDLWRPPLDYTDFQDWDLEGIETYLPNEADNYLFQSNSSQQETTPGMDDEFFIGSSSKPFDNMLNGLSSQFFPGRNWLPVNKPAEIGSASATPDSGVDDASISTPADYDYILPAENLFSLRQLAMDAIKKSKKPNGLVQYSGDALGGLRHTRNKLKLNLPASPNAFSANKTFKMESEKQPTFATFGKSRFSVQHVEGEDDAIAGRNVSFEALPYKKRAEQNLESHIIVKNEQNDDKVKIEIVRGEASLLDSADEDSGIESSTLERKLSSSVEE